MRIDLRLGLGLRLYLKHRFRVDALIIAFQGRDIIISRYSTR